MDRGARPSPALPPVAPPFLSGPAPVSRWLAVPRVAGGRHRRYSPRGGLPGLEWPGARRRRYSPRGGLPGACAASGRALVRPRGGWGWCSCPGSLGAGAPSAWFLVASGRLASPPLAALSWWPTMAGTGVPAGGLFGSMVTLGRDLGGGESLTSALGPMTATLSGAANLVEGVIFPLPSSPVSSPGENLDYGGRAATAPLASLPPLRRRLGSFGGGRRLLSSESFRFCAYLRSVASTLFGLRRSSSGRCFAASLFAADALPSFALAVALSPLSCWSGTTSDGCFAAVVCWLDGCFATFVVLSIFAALTL